MTVENEVTETDKKVIQFAKSLLKNANFIYENFESMNYGEFNRTFYELERSIDILKRYKYCVNRYDHTSSEEEKMSKFIARSKNEFPTVDLLRELYILEGYLPKFMDHCISKLDRSDLELSEDKFKELIEELILKKEFLYNLLLQFHNSFHSCKCIYEYLINEIDKFSNEIAKYREEGLLRYKSHLQ